MKGISPVDKSRIFEKINTEFEFANAHKIFNFL